MSQTQREVDVRARVLEVQRMKGRVGLSRISPWRTVGAVQIIDGHLSFAKITICNLA